MYAFTKYITADVVAMSVKYHAFESSKKLISGYGIFFSITPCSFAVSESDLEPLLEGLTTKDATKDKRLFIIDYKFLKGLPCTDDREVSS